MNNPNRKEVAQETLQIIENGSYRNNLGETVSIKNETNFAVDNSKLFRTEDFPETFELTKIEDETKFEVTDETTLEAAKRICKENKTANPFVLNFASAKNPGGGFLGGAQAQEESLARSSSLYPCLTANFEMYEFNRQYPNILYSDWMIYSPKVPVFRNDDGSLIQTPYLVSFLTSPAVNAGVVKQKEPQNIHLIEQTNRERARKFLWIANKENHKTLILGAWGCGVFQNDPAKIARMFKELLKKELANCFERVIMAIYDKTPSHKVYQAFIKVFE
ncbi:MAG: TIGR02452 family protein [Pyrinomonadaceae bacterium]